MSDAETLGLESDERARHGPVTNSSSESAMEIPTALLTGGSSGIGRGIARELSRNGWRVITTGRNSDRLRETCEGHEATCIPEVWDLSDTPSISSRALELSREHGPFRAFVHCAGIHRLSPHAFLDDEDLHELMHLNTIAPMVILRDLLKARALADGSSVVFLGSAAARRGVPGAAVYSASKSALSGFVRSMALELAGRKMTVNCLEPGIVDTPLTEAMMSRMPETAQELLRQQHPLGFGSIENVAHACEFLLSKKARWITGTEFVVDGGFSAS